MSENLETPFCSKDESGLHAGHLKSCSSDRDCGSKNKAGRRTVGQMAGILGPGFKVRL